MTQKLGVSSKVAGRITLSLFLGVGDKRHNVSLAVRSGSSFCVLKFARPAQNSKCGWELNDKVILLLREHGSKFAWVIWLLESGDERYSEVTVAFPDLGVDGCMAKIKAIQTWRNSSLIAQRKLVPASLKVRCAC